jgi:hypothetical protein
MKAILLDAVQGRKIPATGKLHDKLIMHRFIQFTGDQYNPYRYDWHPRELKKQSEEVLRQVYKDLGGIV